MPRTGAVQLDRHLELKVYSIDSGGSVSVRLSRINAQLLADALLEYAGALGKSNSVDTAQSRVLFGVLDLTENPKASAPVRRSAMRR